MTLRPMEYGKLSGCMMGRSLMGAIATCKGLQSKWLRTAINAFLGPNYLPLSIPPGPDYLPLSLQSTGWDCNQRWWDHIICNSTPSPFSARLLLTAAPYAHLESALAGLLPRTPLDLVTGASHEVITHPIET